MLTDPAGNLGVCPGVAQFRRLQELCLCSEGCGKEAGRNMPTCCLDSIHDTSQVGSDRRVVNPVLAETRRPVCSSRAWSHRRPLGGAKGRLALGLFSPCVYQLTARYLCVSSQGPQDSVCPESWGPDWGGGGDPGRTWGRERAGPPVVPHGRAQARNNSRENPPEPFSFSQQKSVRGRECWSCLIFFFFFFFSGPHLWHMAVPSLGVESEL